MAKDYLEAFKNLKQELYYSPNQIPDVDKWHETIEQALQRLESIDNSNSSEALMFIQELLNVSETEKHFLNLADYNIRVYLIKTKQTLLKSQECYLKAKAFELIILKNVDVKEIRPNATAEAYNSKIPYYRRPLTDDEFKFLKEMVHKLDCEEILFELPKVY